MVTIIDLEPVMLSHSILIYKRLQTLIWGKVVEDQINFTLNKYVTDVFGNNIQVGSKRI